MSTLYLNGKFLAQPLTGVQRYARELLSAADRLRALSHANRRWELLCPPGVAVPPWQTIQARQVGPAGLPLHLWEQTALPWAARDGQLLSLAGSSPCWPAGQLCTLHDAAVFDWPQAYRPLFVAWYRYLFRRQARRALSLFTVSAFSASRLKHHLGAGADRLRVVPDGADHLSADEADPTVLDRLGLRGQRFFLTVGSDNPAKNQQRLLQAFTQLGSSAQDLRLVVVGGGNPEVFSAEKTVAGARPGSDHIVWAGSLADRDLAALYLHAEALVFPSLYEGFGLPPLEAMWLGCPVAVSRAASMPEVCGDAVLYFDPLSVPDMAQAMQRLLTDSALRQSLSKAGRVQAARWRWADAAHQLLRHLKALEPPGGGLR